MEKRPSRRSKLLIGMGLAVLAGFGAQAADWLRGLVGDAAVVGLHPGPGWAYCGLPHLPAT
jgi:hypothetical protein